MAKTYYAYYIISYGFLKFSIDFARKLKDLLTMIIF